MSIFRRSIFNLGDFSPEIVIPTTEIWYKSTDGSAITPYSSTVFGATLLTNTYNEKGIITFDNNVTMAGTNAFLNKTLLSLITFPSTLTTLGTTCFQGCTNLTKISSKTENLTAINSSAFKNCSSLNAFNIKINNVTTIGGSAFYGTNIKNFTILSGMTSLGSQIFTNAGNINSTLNISKNVGNYDSTTSSPFYNNNFETININEGIISVGARAFFNSNSTKYLKYLTLPSTLTSIGSYAFQGNNALECDVIIPTNCTINSGCFREAGNSNYYCKLFINTNTSDYNSESYGSAPFYLHKFQEINFGNNITKIGDRVFYNNSSSVLKKITFSENLLTIGSHCFYYSNNLSSDLILPSSITSIGSGSFKESGGNNIRLIVNCNTSDYDENNSAFHNFTCKEIIINSGVTKIGNRTFGNTLLVEKVSIPSTITTIGSRAFKNIAHNDDFVVPSSVTSLGDLCFYNFGNNIGTLYINCNIPSDDSGNQSFYNVKFPNIIIGEGVTSVGARAFRENLNISSLILPSTLTSVGHQAFSGLKNSENLTINSTSLTLSSLAFQNYGANVGTGTLIVSCNIPSMSSNNEVFNGSKFKTLIINDTVTNIGDRAFVNLSTIENVTLPNTITNIGATAFGSCTSIVDLEIPSSSCTFGSNAFYDIGNGTGTLILNCSVNNSSSGSEVFRNAKFKNVIVNEGVVSLGNRTFANMSTLKNVTLPTTLENIGASTFTGCVGLIDVTIPSSSCTFGDAAFYGVGDGTGTLYINCGINDSTTNAEVFRNTKFNKVILDEGCDSIGNRTFVNRKEITEFEIISTKISKIGVNAFNTCSGITKDMVIPSSVTTIGSNAFNYCGGVDAKLYLNCNIGNFSSTYAPFIGCKFGEIIIGEGVTTIGNCGIYHCNSNMKKVVLPSTLTTIGDYAFEFGGTNNVSNDIIIPSGVTSIGILAFKYFGNGEGDLYINCNIPDVSSNDNTIFYGAKFNNVIIGEGVTSLGTRALYTNTSFKTITLPSTLVHIGTYTFEGCTNVGNDIVLASGITSIGDCAFKNFGNGEGDLYVNCNIPSKSGNDYRIFYGAKFNNVVFGEGVTSVGDRAIYYLSINNLTLPHTLTTIGNYSFEGNANLTTLTLHENVTSIGSRAFYQCSGLTSITCTAIIPPTLSSEVFNNTNNCPIYVPYGYGSIYKTAWPTYESRIIELEE